MFLCVWPFVYVCSGPSHSDGPPAVWCDSQQHEGEMGQCGWSLWLHAAICSSHRWWRLWWEGGSRSSVHDMHWTCMHWTCMTIRNPNMINAKVYGVSLDKGAGWSVRAGAGWVNPSYGVQCYCLCPFWRGAQWPCYKPGNYMWVMEYTFTHTFLSLCGPLSVAIILNNNNPLCKIKSYCSNWTDEHCTLEIWDISKCPQTIQRHINRWFFMSLQYHWALPATSSSLTSLTTQLTSAGILHPKESQVTASCGSRPMG